MSVFVMEKASGTWRFHPARDLTALGVQPDQRVLLPQEGAEEIMKAADSFYKSARWQRLRAAVLRRDGYMCQESRRYGKRVEATTVHHVFPREDFPEYQWEQWNLISLAGDVHDQMHDRQSGALTAKGVELLRRVARREGAEVPLRYR